MLPSLKVRLLGDTADLDRALKRSQAIMANFAKWAVRGLAAVTTGLAALAGMSLRNVDAQAKLARSLGTTTQSMQVMERAGDLAGVAMQGIEQATKDLTRRLSQAATGTGPAVDALDRLGLTARELGDLPLDERIATINQAILDFIPAAEQAAVAGQLFGEEGSIAMSRIDPETIARAAEELERFGGAISDIDARAIEDANDAIGQFKLIYQSIGNQLAVALAPALEAFSNMVASLFEVGNIGSRVISGLVNSLDRIGIYAGIAATALGVTYVAALTRAAGAMVRASIAAGTLRTAIFRTGIGAFIIIAAEGVVQMLRFADKVGGVGEALRLLKDVAVEVFGRIKDAFSVIPLAIQAGSAKMQSVFLGALQKMLQGFEDLTWAVAQGLNELFGLGLSGVSIASIQRPSTYNENGEPELALTPADVMSPLEASIYQSQNAASDAASAMVGIASSLTAPLESVQAIRDAMSGTADEIEDAEEATDNLVDSLGNLGNGNGAGGAGAAETAAEAVEELATAFEVLTENIEATMKSFSAGFGRVIGDARNLKDVMTGMADLFEETLRRMISALAEQGMMQLLTAGVNAAFGSAVMPMPVPAATFEGGGYTGSGSRSGGIDGRGGFMAVVHPNETVIDHTRGQATGRGGTNVVINQSFSYAANGDESVRAIIAQSMPEISAATSNAVNEQLQRRGAFAKGY